MIMNRKSFLTRIGALVAAWWAGAASRAMASPEPTYCSHFVISTMDYCIYDINNKNAAEAFNGAMKEVNEIISCVHAKYPDTKLLDVACRNIRDEICNPYGRSVFFRLLFVQKEWQMGRNSTLINVFSLKDLLAMPA